jgi:hypothetical protein
MMLQDLRVHQVSEYFGYAESHGPRDSATLHFTGIFSPRMMPGSQRAREPENHGTREPRTKGAGEPWTHGFSDTAFQ